MTVYKVKLLPQDVEFEVRQNELILDAAIRQNVSIPYVCRNGTCRTCMCFIHEGTADQLDEEICLISPKELSHGRRLACMTIARSDLVLEQISPRQKLGAEGNQIGEARSVAN